MLVVVSCYKVDIWKRSEAQVSVTYFTQVMALFFAEVVVVIGRGIQNQAVRNLGMFDVYFVLLHHLGYEQT